MIRWPARLALAVPLAAFLALIGGVIYALLGRLTPDALWAAAANPETLAALRLSLLTSAAALAAALLVGLPGGYLLARRDFPGKGWVAAALDLPLFMPPLVAGVGLLFLFGPRLLGEPLAGWGVRFLFSPAGVVLAQSYTAIAVLIPAARGAFAAVDPRYGEAAATLRAGPWAAFWSVEIPLALPGLAAGALLAWSRAISEFGATLMLAGAARFRTETLPMAVYLNIATGETPVAVACGVILLGISAVLLLAVRLAGGRQFR